MSKKAREVAHILGTLRRGSAAAGVEFSLQVAEVLLLIAGGIDTAADLRAVTGRATLSQVTRSLQQLEGRTVPRCRKRPTTHPWRLIERRRHPHKRCDQFRLTLEGIALLSPTFPNLHTPDWTD